MSKCLEERDGKSLGMNDCAEGHRSFYVLLSGPASHLFRGSYSQPSFHCQIALVLSRLSISAQLGVAFFLSSSFANRICRLREIISHPAPQPHRATTSRPTIIFGGRALAPASHSNHPVLAPLSIDTVPAHDAQSSLRKAVPP